MPNIGYTELLIVLAIVLIIFGPKKLPDLGRAIGRSIKEFKDGMKEISTAVDVNEEEKKPAMPKTPPEIRSVPPAAEAAASSAPEPPKTN